MIRGLNDNFYYALRDEGAASDSLFLLKFIVDGDKIVPRSDAIPAPVTGEILALELDALHSNDVESAYHDNDNLDEWKDKLDRVFVIDGRMTLFKLCLEREVRTLNTIHLSRI